MDELKIPISTPFNGHGAAEAKRAIGDLALETRNAASGTKAHGQEAEKAASLLDQFGKRGAAAHDVVEGLTSATRGGVSGLLGLAKAAVNAREALAVSGLGLIVGVALGLGPLLIDLARKFAGMGEDAKEGADKAKDAIAELKRGVEAADKTKLDNLKDAITQVDHAAKNAQERFDALLSAEERVDKSRERLELLHNAETPMLSAEQKARNEVAIRQHYADRATTRERDRLSQGIQFADDTVTRRAGEVAAVEAERAAQAGIVGSLSGRVKSRAQIAQEVELQKSNVANAMAANANGANAAGVAAQNAKLLELQRRLETFASAEVLDRMLATAEQKLKDIEVRLAPAAKALRDARTARDQTLELGLIRERALNESTQLEAQSAGADGRPRIEAAANKDWQTLGSVISGRVAGWDRAPFNERFFHDSGTRDRARAAYERSNSAEDFARAKKSALEISAKIGDGQNDAAEAKALADLLEKLARSVNTNSGNVSDVVARLRNLESQIAAARR